MAHYIGLDVSPKSTAICIVDAKGKIVRGIVTTDPEVISAFIVLHAPEPVRIGWERGNLNLALDELKRLGLPVSASMPGHAKAT